MKDHVVVCGAGSTGRNVIEELLKTGVAGDRDRHARVRAQGHRRSASRRPSSRTSSATRPTTTSWPDQPGRARAASSRRCRRTRTTSTSRSRRGRPIAERADRRALRGAVARREDQALGRRRRGVAELHRRHAHGLRADAPRGRALPRRHAARPPRGVSGSRRSGSATTTRELGTTLRDARVRERFGMTVLAVRAGDAGQWTYNPDADEKLSAGMTLVVLGSAEQVAALQSATT